MVTINDKNGLCHWKEHLWHNQRGVVVRHLWARTTYTYRRNMGSEYDAGPLRLAALCSIFGWAESPTSHTDRQP